LPHYHWLVSPQNKVNAIHLLNRRLPSFAGENIAQCCKHPSNRAAVDSHISPIEIAERLTDPVRSSLADVPRLSRVAFIPDDRETQFEWHIEARHAALSHQAGCEKGHDSNRGAALSRLITDPAGALGELKAHFTNDSMKTLLRTVRTSSTATRVRPIQ
jgi:hypothetical protein